MSDLVKIARQRISPVVSTHWEGCERDHIDCLIQRMADEIERLRAALDALGVAIANAGYTWTPEMRSAYEKGAK